MPHAAPPPAPHDPLPQFWIDVGGTFTDCLMRAPDGQIATHKLLSSGFYKGIVRAGDGRRLTLSQPLSSTPGFFKGWTATLLATSTAGAAAAGAKAGAATAGAKAGAPLTGPLSVADFDAGANTLVLAEDLPAGAADAVGLAIELCCGDEAPVVGIRWLLGRRLDEAVGPIVLKLGTTRGTNALLERQGVPTAFVTTAGFGDVLRIAYQNRPKLFDLAIKKPADLYVRSIEAVERIDARGAEEQPLDRAALKSDLQAAKAAGVTSLAICFLHSYLNDAHERAAEQVADEVGFEQVSLSSRLSPSQRIVPRGDTTVVDAYLTPIIKGYVARIKSRLPQADFFMMTSSGGLVRVDSFVGKDSVLSGPAGGVVGVAHVAEGAGFPSAIGFDMGGTSTDVCRTDSSRPEGVFERRYLMEVNDPHSGAGVRIVAPMLSIETVAAGGGSICWFDGQKICVGPRSAGSNPGPACYGRGGPLAVTDVNLFLGKVLAHRFAFPLDRAAVENRLRAIADDIASKTGTTYTLEELALGFTKVANANMAAAIKKVGLARGYDVRNDVLVSFGGAGAQHACALAGDLGIPTIVQHPHAGILSAFGIGMADVRKFADRHVGRPLAVTTLQELEPTFAQLEAELRRQVADEGVDQGHIEPGRRALDLRYLGQDSVLNIAAPADGDYRKAFEAQHRQFFGFTFPDRGVEILSLRLEVVGASERPVVERRDARSGRPAPVETTVAYFDDHWADTAVYERAALVAGDEIDGPAIIAEAVSTIVVEPGWRARLSEVGDVVLTDVGVIRQPADVGAQVDPVQLELFNNHFASIAEQMGLTLQNTSLSTNVKERLDFSCAVFTETGDLVVNAPHIPVHLGAMSQTVRCLKEDVPDIRPGDVLITNDPYRGGSHLPDVTVITPVFSKDGRLVFFTGSRAHHAEIGGIVPGSMPPFSKSLAEEGVLIKAFRLVEGENASEDRLRTLLTEAPFPSRSVEENLADVRAQVAANHKGAQLLLDMVGKFGLATVVAYMGHIRKAAETKMRAALGRMTPGRRRFEDKLDNGSTIVCTIDVTHETTARGTEGRAAVDFSGTGPVTADNLNANPAIVRSAVLYCFRSLIAEDIPLNDGVLAPVTINVPPACCLNPNADADPKNCPAVGGGNVETSQRVVDAVLGALGVAAASQGTMNNFLFGRKAADGKRGFGYYETIGGGAGAGPGFRGADAVHTHMTNTRITDPEVFEARYPVRLRQFSIRRGSGGAGAFPGGCGMIREVEFLDDLDVSLVTNRRTFPPYGAGGGGPGQPGRNLLRRAGDADVSNGELVDGRTFESLPSAAQLVVHAGDILRLETPGGGGWGHP